MGDVVKMVANEMTRRLSDMFPGTFKDWQKHDFKSDFGFPVEVTFEDLFDKYNRNGIARAGVDKTVLKTWQTQPWLLDHERDGSEDADGEEGDGETPLEKSVRLRFKKLRVWQRLAEADRRALVGGWAGVIFRFADGMLLSEPAKRVAGLDALVEIIPTWAGQLSVSEWFTDERDAATYGLPKMYHFSEASVGLPTTSKSPRQFQIHPSRVLIWSKDGTTYGRSLLEPGFNDLINMEKVVGAGGEGFWKNSKAAPVIEVDPAAKVQEMAKAMGVKPDEMADLMNDQVAEFNAGFDKMLMLQGMTAKTLAIHLPSPEHFFAIALQGFAASIPIPLKILVGSQTGERASTEDAAEWSQTNMARRADYIVPTIETMVDRFVELGVLPAKDWFVDWDDLTEATMPEKIDRAGKMADVNQKMKDSGEFIFTPEEIRETVDLEPLRESDKKLPDLPTPDEAGLTGAPKPKPRNPNGRA